MSSDHGENDNNDPTSEVERRLPIGAEPQEGGGVHFRVWAPKCESVTLQFAEDLETFDQQHGTLEMQSESGGYFSTLLPEGRAGLFYRFLVGGDAFPDPVSRFQPAGLFGPSQVIDPSFSWTDDKWAGLRREGQVIYEMHIGTFTQEGTWEAAMEQLPELADLGVTVLEIMPVATFAGNFGWGYDGVLLFAPTHLYGTPDGFRAFVNRAHELGLGVILDVVYNHLGPGGDYLKRFSDDFFSTRYTTDWGEALNFDDTNSEAVREFVLSNASYWIREFHLDGLRIDATQSLFDASPQHIVAAIASTVRKAGGERSTYLVGENEPQETRLLKGADEDGYGLDALWNDDFHHTAMVALTGQSEAYYADYKGTPQEFVSSMKHGFLYQGQWYRWQNQRRGTPSLGLPPSRFVTFLQNHDQVANSLRGQRVHELTSPGALRAMTAVLLLGPATPMLFQGQEFAADSPFLFFANHEGQLASEVKQGRRDFLAQFPRIASPGTADILQDPAEEQTFRRCKLDFNDRQRHSEIYQLHRDLLNLRKHDPVFSAIGDFDGAVLSAEAFVVRYFSAQGDRLLLVNLGRDLDLDPVPEPLLAPEHDSQWLLLWSSEDPVYGGGGTPPPEENPHWWLPARSALVMATTRPREDH